MSFCQFGIYDDFFIDTNRKFADLFWDLLRHITILFQDFYLKVIINDVHQFMFFAKSKSKVSPYNDPYSHLIVPHEPFKLVY